MLTTLNISSQEILQQVQLSCLMPSVIEGIVAQRIIDQVAVAEGIAVELAEVQQAADNLRLAQQLHSASETWVWLQKHYLTLDDFEALAYATVLSTKLAQHLFAPRVELFFAEHRLDYDRVIFYEVVLDDPDTAMELYYAIQAGETSFHAVSHQYIQDPVQRRQGGYRGLVHRGELRPEISAAVFAATPPQVLKPILTSQGAHLILVEEILPAQLNEALRHQILSNLFGDWLKQKVNQVQVSVQLTVTPDVLTSLSMGSIVHNSPAI
jgi:parvulin-like peptidyl-prolyl isomerase